MLSMVHLSSPPFENVGLDEIDVASAESVRIEEANFQSGSGKTFEMTTNMYLVNRIF